MKFHFGIVLLLCTAALIGRVSADGCSGGTCPPAEMLDPALSRISYIEGPVLLTGVKELRGAVQVNGSLTIKDCMLSLDGIGISVSGGGSLTITNSTVTPSMSNLTCFLSVMGGLRIESSTLRGFTDPRDSLGLIGFYIGSSSVTITDSTILDSGIFMFSNCTVESSRSHLSGAFIQGGAGSFFSCTIDGYGITYDGRGELTVEDCVVTSDVEFVNGVSGISATSGADLKVEGTSISGTYSAGIFAQEGSIELSGIGIDLSSAIYGLKLDLAEVRTLSDIEIAGANTGVSIYSCTPPSGTLKEGSGTDRPVTLGPLTIRGGYIGIEIQNSVQTSIVDCIISGTEAGIRAMGPATIAGTTFESTDIGVLLEGMYESEIRDCEFTDYSSWAVQEQSWEPSYYPSNTYQPGEDACGDVAWWGYVTVAAEGSEGLQLKGASLLLRSEIGEYRRSPGRIDVIWGYASGSSVPNPVVYDGEVRWGSSSANFELVPEEDLVQTVDLPLGDISIVSIERDGGDLVLTLGMSGTGSGVAELKVYVDEEEVYEESIEMSAGESSAVRVTDAVSSGPHDVKASVTSADEYRGGDLQDNNVRSVAFEKERGDTDTALWIFVGLLVAILAGVVVYELTFRRR